MTEFIKRTGLLLLSIVIIANLLAYASLAALRNGNFYKPSFLVNSITERNFDYIVIGASTGLTTLNTQVIDSLTGKKGLNLSVDDTNLPSQFLMLQHFLAQDKTTKTCVLVPNVMSYTKTTTSLSDNDYRFLPYVNNKHVSDYYEGFSSTPATLMAQSSWFPMGGISYYNTELFYPALVSFLYPDRHNRFDTFGNYTYPMRQTEVTEIIQKQFVELGFNNPYLQKVKDLCDANSIKLICYISPLKEKSIVTPSSKFEVINHADILNNTSYFYDDIHVNSKGRFETSVQFAEDLYSELNEVKAWKIP